MHCVSQSLFCFFRYFRAHVMTTSMFSKTSNHPRRFIFEYPSHTSRTEQSYYLIFVEIAPLFFAKTI